MLIKEQNISFELWNEGRRQEIKDSISKLNPLIFLSKESREYLEVNLSRNISRGSRLAQLVRA